MLPDGFAIVNPNRLDESEAGAAHGHLAAVGMAFLLGAALLRTLRGRGFFAGREEPKLIELLDLVALGTVADVAQLRGLNRAFVTQGLKVMAGRRNLGLAALADAARLNRRAGMPRPRLRARARGSTPAGRVGKSDLGVRLLTTEDRRRGRTIAAELDRLNEERRAIEAAVCEAAEALAATQGNRAVALVAASGWHPGVIGIVAGRLKEKLHRPAIVIAMGEDGIGKGSGRSISGVDLGAAVLAAKDSGLLVAGGGHAMAAGLTVAGDGIEALADFLDERLAADVARSRDDRALLLDALLAPRRHLRAPIATRSRRAGPMAPAGRGRASPPVRSASSRRTWSATAICASSPPARTAAGSRRSPSAWPKARSARRCSRPRRTAGSGSPAGSSATIIHGGDAAELHLEDAAWADA